MSRYEKILEKAMLGSDLPGEPVPGQPLVEISGDRRVYIENHCGISMYGMNEIRIKVAFGTVSVCGSNMELVHMNKQQLVILGNIHGVALKRMVR